MPQPPRSTVLGVTSRANPIRGDTSCSSCPRGVWNGGKLLDSPREPSWTSQRAPTFTVSRDVACQSSCNHVAKTCIGSAMKKLFWDTLCVHENVCADSPARFHVDGSFHTGNRDSKLAGGCPFVAFSTPFLFWGQKID